MPIRTVIPNALTVLALCAGLTAIRFALEARFEAAVAAIIIASVFDALDGRVARLLKGTTRFGAELDSLTDFVNFGVAPVIVLYLWSLNQIGGIGWIAVLGYAVCCALRLARFNVALEDPDKPAWAGNYFVGVPAPAGAMLVMIPLYLTFIDVPDIQGLPLLVAAHCFFVAFLMVSRIPTFSGKRIGLRIKRDMVMPILPVAQAAAGGSGPRFARRVFSATTLAVWTRQLAGLVTSGLPLERALTALADEAENERARELLAHLKSEVNAGSSFARALATAPREFDEVYRAVVAAGEQSGALGAVLSSLADDLEERQALRGKLVAAMLYPAIVSAIALTLRRRKDTKSQVASEQLAARREERVRLVSMTSGKK
jgi:CDP-diacylglycerol--serine O-phosphatidyltransferase